MCRSGGCLCVSPDQWNHGAAGLSTRHLARLGVVVRLLGHLVVGTRLSAVRSSLSSLWIQCVCGILGCPLCLREDRLRDDPGRSAGHKISNPQNPELQATALMATPTYILGMADTARNQLHLDPAALPITKITSAGEPGALIPATKTRMEEAWGAKVYDHAGATEIGAWGFECSSQPGALHVNEAMFLAEVEDLETGKPVTEPGQRGKLVITALDRSAQPCIRFDSKDIVEIGEDQCECGRTYKLFKGGVVGRADDITKVKGVLLAPSAIEDVVRSVQGLGNEYEVIVEKRGDVDNITLKVELTEELASPRRRNLRQNLRLSFVSKPTLATTSSSFRPTVCPGTK